jgi:enoyl-[acyl-carrier protein] reductase II
MIRTTICDLFGIEAPIVQAGMGPFTCAEMAAAVANAGGLGSLGATARSVADLRAQMQRTRELTNHPFAVNFTLSPSLPNEEAFAQVLKARPHLISFALGDPGDYVKRAHDAGILVMHQVTTRQQAVQAAARGVDAIVAQGSESGGFGGIVAAMALIPQVVDAVSPIPVIAAGGIADGRGLAAALMLGAQGINIGTRFLTSRESPIRDAWKQAILAAESEDTMKFDVWGDIFPPGEGAYPAIPRVLTSAFIGEWHGRHDDAQQEAAQLRDQVVEAMTRGTLGEMLPFTGQTAGLIREILPAAEITRRIVAEAEEVLRRTIKILA